VIEAQTVQPSLTTPRASRTHSHRRILLSYRGGTTRDHEIFSTIIPYLSLRGNVVVLARGIVVSSKPGKDV
jgi:hypothetical protein